MPDYDKVNPKPELIIGIAGPTGPDLDLVAKAIRDELSPYAYKSSIIKASKIIESWCKPDVIAKLAAAHADERISLLMNAGDAIRAAQRKGQALVPLMLANIRSLRAKVLKDRGIEEEGIEAYNRCYIINSLKHPDEIKALRSVYGPKFILVSAFSGIEARKERLGDLIAKTHHATNNGQFDASAEKLIEIDSQRPNTELGQNLRHTFPLADLFVCTESDLGAEIERFFEAFFSNPYKTPKVAEYYMFEASAASLRSADLSRQVGAVLVDKSRGLLTKGCNEVPTFGGGTYWPDDPPALDNRDWKKGQDFNSVKKVELLEELLKFLAEKDLVELPEEATPVSIVDRVVFGEDKDSFKNLRVSNLIEFGRMVHAEMSALMDAARRGISVQNSTLYCTTFPCHMCSRHIISAGVRKVVYIEPYPKSMTQELFPETVLVDGTPERAGQHGDDVRRVRFEPFVGVAPRMYTQLFSHIKRKDDRGYIVEWAKKDAQPRVCTLATAHLKLEQTLAKDVDNVADVGLDELNAIEGTRTWLA